MRTNRVKAMDPHGLKKEKTCYILFKKEIWDGVCAMEEIISRQNKKIAHMKRLGTDRKYRNECGEFLCDGIKLFNEALVNGLEIVTVLTTAQGITAPGAEVYNVSRELLEYVSPLVSAQNIIFSCRIPEREKTLTGHAVILENVQDPGNVGTMIRTANAVGISSFMLLGDCADLYNPKTIRAAMGAVFRQNVFTIDRKDVLELKKRRVKIYCAYLSDESVPISEIDCSGCVFVIGNEGSGISDELLGLCDERIIIPMEPECESLNAASAATVIMWEMRGGFGR